MCKSSNTSRTRSGTAFTSTDKALNSSIAKGKIAKAKTTPPANLDEIEKSISRDQLDQYLEDLHQAFKKLNSKNPSTSNRQQEYIMEKICEKCDNVHCDELLLLCDICDDAYHTFCLDPPLEAVPPEDEDWICPVCCEQKRLKELKEKEESLALRTLQTPKNQRQSTLDEHFTIEQHSKTCFGCNEMISDKTSPAKEATMGKKTPKPSKVRVKEICIRCNHYFHPDCFNKKKTSILCTSCETNVDEVLPKSEKKILNFFGVKNVKRDYDQSGKKGMETETSKLRLSLSIGASIITKVNSKPKKAKGSKKVTYSRNSASRFKLPKPSSDPQKVLRQKMSLAFGLLTKNIAFNDDLCYSNPNCPDTCNDTALEPNLQKMDKANIEIFNQFKEMTRNGNYAPVMVEEDKNQGFIVRADDNIAKLTLIAEYVGEVDFARNRVFDKNDSIMDLLRTPHSCTSLVICPETKGNLARFLSGINNSDKTAKLKKQNIKSIRYNINGQARVLLYAARAIKKGEVLYYDYNEGGFGEYPTEDFV